MNQPGSVETLKRQSRHAIRVCLLAATHAWLLTSCSIDRPMDVVTGAAYTPSNVHRDAPKLPINLRRVAVLPLATSLDSSHETAARECLEPILLEELAKTGRFEIVKVSPEKLQQRTGQPRWLAEAKLPAGFLQSIQDTYACDAVLFSQVTVFRAYPPLAIGWRLKLVGMPGTLTHWAVDEVFDAGQPAVVNGARLYQKGQQQPGGPFDDSRAILQSPRRFGHYTAATLVGTLPQR